MRQNDPENLRVPALNLILELLPDDSQAGVWTFGQWVNMLIPPNQVDDAWREQAKQKAKAINSHGLRTNIGEAMEKATWKFEKDSEYDQHVILLTDGLVDIAADNDPLQQQKNETERQRILNAVLKQYQALGIKIHTIGLSENADKVLLQKLSLTTGGMSETVTNSEDLVKAFLKTFEKAAPEAAEQVPLADDNSFEIDASVEEFTALVFRKKGSLPTQLQTPSGAIISQIKSSENARWFGESVYDLVTVTKPEEGKWLIKADLDPDNRVTVVSDLKMEIAGLPSSLFPGQQVNFQVYLHEDGNVITRPEFLRLMTVEMTMTAESGRSGSKVISDPESVPADGRYHESIKRLSNEGQYELKVTVDGKTFQRMRKEYIQVRQPIGFEIRKRMVEGKEVYAVRVIPQVPDIEVARTRVIGKFKGPDQHSIIQAIPWIEEGLWETIITENKGPGVYEVAMNVKGRFAQDQEFRIKPDPIVLTFPIPADFNHQYFVKEEMTEAERALDQDDAQTSEALESTEQETADGEKMMPDLAGKMQEQEEPTAEIDNSDPEKEVATETSAENESTEDGEAAEIETEEPIPFWLYILIPVSTLLLGLGGFFVFRQMQKKKSAGQPELNDKVAQEPAMETSASLNDGMDDEDFDEDFDLSDDGEDLDDLDSLDLSNDDDGSLDDIPDLDEDLSAGDMSDDVNDEIPDFDENFDIAVDEPKEEVVEPEVEADDTSAAIDELDSVLDSLTDDDESIPQLEDEVVEEAAESGDADDEFDLDTEGEPEAVKEEAEQANEGEAAIDEALANLESELDDIDVDALMDDSDDKKEE